MNENQRTVTLPTIPKEVADAIERMRLRGHSAEHITAVASRTGGGLHRDTVTLQTIPFDTLMSALVNGYVVEKSAEEQAYDTIREAHAERCDDYASIGDYSGGYADGIEFTLNELGIKIEGVNA
jgi:hypothetical protein